MKIKTNYVGYKAYKSHFAEKIYHFSQLHVLGMFQTGNTHTIMEDNIDKFQNKTN